MADQAETIARKIIRDVRALPRRDTPSIRAIRVKATAALKDAEPMLVLAIAEVLVERDLRWVGYELIHHHRATLAQIACADVERLGSGLHSWDTVDAFGIYISGPAWLHKQVTDADVRRWAKSENLWWRRVALVSTVVLNSKSRGKAGGDAKRTLAIVRLLIDDREDMIVKAVSWALRVLGSVDPEPVHAFLREHDQRLAARVKRETRTKLETGLKNPSRKGARP